MELLRIIGDLDVAELEEIVRISNDEVMRVACEQELDRRLQPSFSF